MDWKDINIVFVDDEESLVDNIKEYFNAYSIKSFFDPYKALQEILKNKTDILIVDYKMPKFNGLEFLLEARKNQSYGYGILSTAYANKDLLEEAINHHLVKKIIEKPYKLKLLKDLIDHAIEYCLNIKDHENRIEALKWECDDLKKQIYFQQDDIVGIDKGLKHVYEKVTKVAPFNSNVLLTGETGTGKEVIANQIHRRSLRKDNNFIKINSAAIPDHLLESELFGFVKGAFTGAIQNKKGKIELADRGTLFLDEISELKLDLQAKLLRVLQEKEIQQLGSNKIIKVDFRLIASTNKDLQEMINRKEFREDLYYRINELLIYIPPLRERMEDIEDFTRFFISKFCCELNIKKPIIHPSVFLQLCNYKWSGNVRELQNAIKRVLIMFNGEKEIKSDHFDFLFIEKNSSELKYHKAIDTITKELCKKKISLKKIEEDILYKIYAISGNKISKAVIQSGIAKDRFYRFLKKSQFTKIASQNEN
jgi:DNA-binding NtrC family response regulator